MDSARSSSPSSGSGSLPSRSDSVPSKSLRSSLTGSPVSRSRPDRDYDSVRSGVPSKLLSRLLPKEHQETLSLRTILAVTKDRLESETRRADEAERRVLEVLRRLRTTHEATLLAQSDAAHVREELTLYKYRLDDALRQLKRAQEIINELEHEKEQAELDASRARTVARKYREQHLVARARQEGREQGFQEGLSRGRDLGYQDALEDEDVDDGEDADYLKRPVLVEEVEDEEGEIAPSQYRAELLLRIIVLRHQGLHIWIIQRHLDLPPPERVGGVTPLCPMWHLLHPPSHSPQSQHRPKSNPRQVRPEDVPPPIPIQEPMPSPAHPSESQPPDSWIPYEDPSGEIFLPPPHELSRPMTPASMTPMPPPADAQAQPITSDEIRTHPERFLYAHPASSQSGPISRSQPYRPFSPQSKASKASKASTSISQFELVGSRNRPRAASAREDRVPTSPRGPRPREDLPPIRPEMGERQDTRETTTTSTSSDRNLSPTSPLDRVFKRRYRSRPSKETVIPEIVVQSPSTPTSSRTSSKSGVSQPHLLSPEHNSRPLPPQDDVVVMRMEIPGYHPTVPSRPYAPPRPEDDDEPPVVPPLPEEQFPPGFVPLTPPIHPGSPSGSPLPIPSNNPLPVPPNNPLPIRQNSPLPVRQSSPLPVPQSSGRALPIPSNNPLPIPPSNPLPIPHHSPRPVPQSPVPPVPTKDPLPIPQNNPLPIPHDDPLPVPHRSGTPRSQRYAEAPLPSGVAYPSPPSRRSRTPGSSRSSPPGARRGIRSPPGERLSPLPLHFFAPLRSDTNTE
ncbi:hypothetical protein BN946_scf184993.g6 [Trametes cinnabarina]|uniref:Uncharacterized protein n=1 Tax=Pycnoporus cinnabarinus TaxID=5643 RepID=A0A060SYW7_PYCCI|nr:hypothetical protein BN946_scf184993.g6 [Trametes cinnabarina]